MEEIDSDYRPVKIHTQAQICVMTRILKTNVNRRNAFLRFGWRMYFYEEKLFNLMIVFARKTKESVMNMYDSEEEVEDDRSSLSSPVPPV